MSSLNAYNLSTPQLPTTSLSSQFVGTENSSFVYNHTGAEIEFFVHTLFTVIAPVCLLWLWKFFGARGIHPYLMLLYPGHNVRYVFSFICFILLLNSLGEGILTSIFSIHSHDIFLYLPEVFALLCGLLQMIYCHYMERWNKPQMVYLLVFYWTAAIGSKIVTIICLVDEIGFDINVLRLDNNVLLLSFYILIFMLDVNIVRTKILGWRYTEHNTPEDLLDDKVVTSGKCTSLHSRLFKMAYYWLISLSQRKQIEIEDLGNIQHEYKTEQVYKKFLECYNSEKSKRKHMADCKPSLWKVLFCTFKGEIIALYLLKTLSDFLLVVPFLTISSIIDYVSKDESAKVTQYISITDFYENGFVLSFVVLIVNFVTRLLRLHANGDLTQVAIKALAALRMAVYEKATRATSQGETGFDAGQIVNYAAADCNSAMLFICKHIYLVTFPFPVILAVILLFREIGIIALLALPLALIMLSIQMVLNYRGERLERQAMEYSDQRVRKTNELLQGIKLLKLYGWEKLQSRTIVSLREHEKKNILSEGKLLAVSSYVALYMPVILSFVMLLIFGLINPDLMTPNRVFPALALTSFLFMAFSPLPVTFLAMMQFVSAIKRLSNFLAQGDFEEHYIRKAGAKENIRHFHRDSETKGNHGSGDGRMDETTHLITNGSSHAEYSSYPLHIQCSTDPPEDVAIQIENGYFSWDLSSSDVHLNNINVQFPKGGLSMIIGTVGSGKSSLVLAILGEMAKVSGTVKYNRKHCRVSYGAQIPWLQNATLRDNILFDQPYNEKRYNRILEACALMPDLQMLPAGDQTEIGERGINLSGGQKQRISVARALYFESDIVILDDPLSALDVHVGEHLMNNGILTFLKNENRSILLVTHQLKYVYDADMIFVMDNGRVSHQGNINDIKKMDNESYKEWKQVIEIISQSEEESASDREAENATTKVEPRKLSDPSDGALMTKETVDKNVVTFEDMKLFLNGVGVPCVILLVAVFSTTLALTVYQNLWLSKWTTAVEVSQNATEPELEYMATFYASWFSVLTVALNASALALSLFQIIGGVICADRLHTKLLNSTIHARMRFFDTTPVGRIINMFSNDMQAIDKNLPVVSSSGVLILTQIIGPFMIAMYGNPYFILGLLPLTIVFYLVVAYTSLAFRMLRSLENAVKSPMLSHLTETISGLPSIRAFRQETRFRKKMTELLDHTSNTHSYLWYTAEFVNIALIIITVAIVFSAFISTLVAAVYGAVSPSMLGLVIATVLSAGTMFQTINMMYEQTLLYLNSVGRIAQYISIESEDYQGSEPDTDWPTKGVVDIKGVYVRYDKTLDPVLKNVSLHIKSGMKLGICGRTGSGKSSLTLALFRVIDTFKGCIMIDGVDIASVPLRDLRQRLAIIPQDPKLFAGSIRSNLDPEDRCTDNELWEALEIAQMKDYVMNLDGQLDSEVAEGGENFSVGQKQLFCVARAFLRKSRILVMDEATASIDSKTDAILQGAVAKHFKDKTVISIAHRIGTILDSDMVLVLGNGNVVEFDTPERLLSKENGVFSSLVAASHT